VTAAAPPVAAEVIELPWRTVAAQERSDAACSSHLTSAATAERRIDTGRRRKAHRQAERRRRSIDTRSLRLPLALVDLSDVDLPVSHDSASAHDRARYRHYVDTVTARVAAVARKFGPCSPLVKHLTAAVVAAITTTQAALQQARIVSLDHHLCWSIGLHTPGSGARGRTAGDSCALTLCPRITPNAAHAPPIPLRASPRHGGQATAITTCQTVMLI